MIKLSLKKLLKKFEDIKWINKKWFKLIGGVEITFRVFWRRIRWILGVCARCRRAGRRNGPIRRSSAASGPVTAARWQIHRLVGSHHYDLDVFEAFMQHIIDSHKHIQQVFKKGGWVGQTRRSDQGKSQRTRLLFFFFLFNINFKDPCTCPQKKIIIVIKRTQS